MHPKKLEMDEAQDYPECFPPGTLVLTRHGYRPIESIEVGDEVFTHRRRWRCVTSTATRIRDTVRISGHGHPGLTVSKGHRFYAIEEQVGRVRGSDRSADGHVLLTPVQTFSAPGWVPASELEKCWWSAPTRFPKASQPPSPIKVGGRRSSMAWDEGSEDTLWLMGLYLADGSIGLRDGKPRSVTYTVHIDEEDEVLRRCDGANLPYATPRQVGGSEKCVGITINDPLFAEWLHEHCGHGAYEKQVPAWVYGLRTWRRRAVLEGALFGDGNAVSDKRYLDGRWKFTTVGKAQAAAMKTLAVTLGYAVSWYWVADEREREIRGRSFRFRDGGWYQLVGSPLGEAFDHDLLRYQRVRRVTEAESEVVLHDLGVEEDESFVVEGIVVHNSGWVELGETLKYGSKDSQWRAHGVSRGVRDRYYKQSQPESGWMVHRYGAMHRPDWTPEERAAKIELYGSRDSSDYKRNISGLHGDASSSLFVLTRLMACFVGTTQVQTPVGIQPIQELSVGDQVLNASGSGEILAKQVSTRDRLVRVVLDSGEQFLCTPEHPFFTERGWCHADRLRPDDHLVGHREAVRLVWSEDHLNESGQVLREALRRELAGEYVQDSSAADQNPEALRTVRDQVLSSGQNYSLLRQCVRCGGQGGAASKGGFEALRDLRDRVLAVAEDDSLLFVQLSGDLGEQESREEALSCWSTPTGRSPGWTAGAPVPALAGLGSRVAAAVVDEPTRPGPRTHLRPTGSCSCGDKDGGGGGWTQSSVSSGAGPADRGVAFIARVADVEVLEPGHPDFDALCSVDSQGDSGVQVYDLTVSGHPSFVVGETGVLVHNCVDSRPESPYNSDEYHHLRITDDRLRDAGVPIEALLDLPASHQAYDRTWIGADIGMTNHPTEILVLGEHGGKVSGGRLDGGPDVKLKLLTRIHMERISSPDQRAVFAGLNAFYRPQALAIDRTGLGLPIYSEVMQGSDRQLASVFRGYNFSEKIAVGYEQPDEDEEPAKEDEPYGKPIMANVLEYSSDMLRLLVDGERLILPWDLDLIREFQGQTYTLVRSTTNPYGKKEFSSGKYHTLDAARMAVLPFMVQGVEQMRKVINDEPVFDAFVTF